MVNKSCVIAALLAGGIAFAQPAQAASPIEELTEPRIDFGPHEVSTFGHEKWSLSLSLWSPQHPDCLEITCFVGVVVSAVDTQSGSAFQPELTDFNLEQGADLGVGESSGAPVLFAVFENGRGVLLELLTDASDDFSADVGATVGLYLLDENGDPLEINNLSVLGTLSFRAPVTGTPLETKGAEFESPPGQSKVEQAEDP